MKHDYYYAKRLFLYMRRFYCQMLCFPPAVPSFRCMPCFFHYVWRLIHYTLCIILAMPTFLYVRCFSRYHLLASFSLDLRRAD